MNPIDTDGTGPAGTASAVGPRPAMARPVALVLVLTCAAVIVIRLVSLFLADTAWRNGMDLLTWVAFGGTFLPLQLAVRRTTDGPTARLDGPALRLRAVSYESAYRVLAAAAILTGFLVWTQDLWGFDLSAMIDYAGRLSLALTVSMLAIALPVMFAAVRSRPVGGDR